MAKQQDEWESRLSDLHVQGGGFSEVLMQRILRASRKQPSRNRSLRWKSLSAAVAMVMIVGAVGGGLLRQHHQGAAPGTLTVSGPLVLGNGGTLHMVDASTGWALAQGGTQVLHTNNGGAYWTVGTPRQLMSLALKVQDEVFINGREAWLAAQPTDGSNPGTEWMLFRTTNAGKDWTSSILPFVHDASAQVKLNVSGQTAYLADLNVRQGVNASNVKLYQSTDGGVQWHVLSSAPVNPNQFSKVTRDVPNAIDFWSAENGLMATPVNPVVNAAGSQTTPVVFSTSDGGRTWKPIRSFPLAVWSAKDRSIYQGTGAGMYQYNGARSIYAENGQSFAVGTQYYRDGLGWVDVLWTTHDGGDSWQASRGVWPSAHIIGDAYDFEDMTHVDLIAGQRLYRTQDGGRQWTSIPLKVQLQQVQFMNSKVGYGWSLQDIVYKTVDGGRTWQALQTQIQLRNEDNPS